MIGKKIKNARLKKNLSQGDLAKTLMLSSPQFVSNIERGVAPLPPKYIPILSKELGFSEQELVDDLVLAFEKYCWRQVRLYSKR